MEGMYLNKDNMFSRSYGPGILYTFQAPEIDECLMVAIKHYDVRISSSDGEIMLERAESDNEITFMLDDDLIITLKVNVTVVNINGQRSESSVVERSIASMHIPNKVYSKYIASYNSCNYTYNY